MKKLLVGVVLGAMLVSAGMAVASIPDSNGVIHGCYLTTGNPNVRGALRVIDTDAGQTCGSGETAITWSQIGPQGAVGPTGATGPEGSLATANLQVRSYSVGTPDVPLGYTDLRIQCEPGETPISGGYEFPRHFDPQYDDVVADQLVRDPNTGRPSQYRIIAQAGVADLLTIQVLCASP